MADQFSNSVSLGLKLSRRIYYGKDHHVLAPPAAVMDRNPSTKSDFSTGTVAGTHLPTGPMLYAEVSEPSMVDNPDIPSYQPYVHGKCEQLALIPLHMHGITMEVNCYLDSAFVTVAGKWKLHCVSASRSCDCRIAIPMGPQGSILGVEVECPAKSFSTELVKLEDGQQEANNKAKAKDGFLLKGYIYTLKVPQVDGGSVISVRASWYQKLLYQDNQFCLNIPFSFQPYVTPVGKKIPKVEKIHLNVNSGVLLQILCKSASHPLKVMNRQAGKLEFSYEREVPTWSTNDLGFSYSVSANDLFGSVLVQSPTLHDFDQRDMFCLYLYPGDSNNKKCFKREVIFLVDVSASMKGCPIEHTKTAVLAALSKVNSDDSFNIITFNEETLSFSSSLVPEKAHERWKEKGCKSAHLLKEGVFLFKFGTEDQMKSVMEGGPWHYFECPIILQIWNPKMDFDTKNVKELPIWIRFPFLRVHLWNEAVLSKLASPVGKPMFTDNITQHQKRVDYARICVMVNAESELPNVVPIKDPDGEVIQQQVEYEWLPPICDKCKCFGHSGKECTKQTTKKGGNKGKQVISALAKRKSKEVINKSSRGQKGITINSDGEGRKESGKRLMEKESENEEMSSSENEDQYNEISIQELQICIGEGESSNKNQIEGQMQQEELRKGDSEGQSRAMIQYQPNQVSMSNFFQELEQLDEEQQSNMVKSNHRSRKAKSRGKTAYTAIS